MKEPIYTRRSTYTLLLLGFIVSLMLFGTSVMTNQDVRSRAAPTTIVSLVVQKAAVTLGEEFTVEVRIDSGNNQIVAADIEIIFDANALEGLSIENGSFLPNVFIPGTISQGSGRIVLASGPTDPRRGSGTLAILRLRAKQPVAYTTISFSPATQASEIGSGQNAITSKIDTSISIASFNTPDTQVQLLPESIRVTPGERFYVPIYVRSGSNQVLTADIAVLFDQSYFDPISFVSGGFLSEIIQAGSADGGVAKIVVGAPGQIPRSGEGVIAVLELLAKKQGVTTVSLDPSTKLSSFDGGQNLVKSLLSTVVTVTDQNASEPSPSSTTCPRPPSPMIASISPNTTSATLRWSMVTGATYYGIVYGTRSGVYTVGIGNVGNKTSYVVSDLTPGTTYYFAVFSGSDCGVSDYSVSANVTTSSMTNLVSPIPTTKPKASVEPSFVPIDPNQQAAQFLVVKPRPSVSPLPQLVIPFETDEEVSQPFLTTERLVIGGIVTLILGTVLVLWKRRR